ncbi:hypothetical protein BDF20DRAFT_989930 [Mycotypha africana]|uniref:uncharacterized protein n=1 Tax=Mycotypha africana TaxID=64632 RepID=UPI002300A599|nr:uncharacterized protein BDF20DRAFT_989930 [Mycotypha africana]KAI8971659.1 hypothetical protein BDF20DRAFT_989930 [Mycotypha africana]
MPVNSQSSDCISVLKANISLLLSSTNAKLLLAIAIFVNKAEDDRCTYSFQSPDYQFYSTTTKAIRFLKEGRSMINTDSVNCRADTCNPSLSTITVKYSKPVISQKMIAFYFIELPHSLNHSFCEFVLIRTKLLRDKVTVEEETEYKSAALCIIFQYCVYIFLFNKVKQADGDSLKTCEGDIVQIYKVPASPFLSKKRKAEVGLLLGQEKEKGECYGPNSWSTVCTTFTKRGVIKHILREGIPNISDWIRVTIFLSSLRRVRRLIKEGTFSLYQNSLEFGQNVPNLAKLQKLQKEKF